MSETQRPAAAAQAPAAQADPTPAKTKTVKLQHPTLEGVFQDVAEDKVSDWETQGWTKASE